MPTAVAGGRGPAPPLAPHISLHHIRAPEEQPDRVVLLAPLTPRDTHWITARGGERARTVPCDGDGCHWCPKFVKRVNLYGPALLAITPEPGGPTAWGRVVLYVPKAAMKWFTNVRGAAHEAYCKRDKADRGTKVYAKNVTLCFRVDEPSFEVQPALDLVWGVDGAPDAMRRLRESLTVNPLPPLFERPRPSLSASEMSAQLDHLNTVVDRQRAMIESIERAMKNGTWPGSRNGGEKEKLTAGEMASRIDTAERVKGGGV